ncbi:hypothetical protein OL548_26240 [Lysinibacillus sp. MHQ-1]|nr:hypothetical protein OL548_26240 [Lysinibacillus sp. MHQ-1]
MIHWPRLEMTNILRLKVKKVKVEEFKREAAREVFDVVAKEKSHICEGCCRSYSTC